jgi:hypothetical protein
MKFKHFIALAVCACSVVILQCVPPASAQSLATPQSSGALPPWNAADEITVSGAIDSVVSGHVSGTPGGFNLRVSSSRGDLYANLGPHLGEQLTKQLTSGQFLTLTGMIRTYNGDNYVLARTLNFNGRTYVIRNSHGIPVNVVSNSLQSTRIHQGSFGGAR